jgi:chemotaxis protein histidine kinase CheA
VKERSEAIERQKIQDEENERMKNRENEIRKQYDEEQRQKKFEEDQKQFEEEQRQKQFEEEQRQKQFEEEQRQKQFEEEQRQKQFEEEQRQKQAEAFQKQLEKEEREREERNQREQENREKEEEKQRLKVEKEELQRKEENELLEERKKKEEQMKIDEAERDARKKEHDEIVALSKKDDQESDDETSKSETKTLTKDVPTVKLIGQQHSLYDIESDDDDDDDDEKVVDVLKLAKRYFITVRISMFMKTLRILLDLFNVSFSCNKDVTPDELIDVMMSGDIMWNSPKDTDKKANVPDWFSEIISSQCVQMRIQKTISLKIMQKMWTTIKQHTKQMQSINDVGRDFYERRFRDQILSSFACQVVRVLVERCLFIGKSLNREISQEFISHFVHDFFQIRRDDFARNCRSINESINVSPFLQNYKDACSSLEMYFKTFDEKKGQNLYIFSIFANP